MELNSIYREFLDYLNTTGVRYAMLHDWETLAPRTGSDLDLVIAADDLQKLEPLLQRQYRIVTMFHYEASSFGFVLTRNGDGSVFIADFITDYRWNGRIFFTNKELLQERRQQCGVWVVGLLQELAYLLVKKVYEKGSVPEHQKRRLKELIRETGRPAHDMASRLLGAEWGALVMDWIVHGRWSQFEANIKRLRRRLRWELAKSDPLNPICYWVAESSRVWQRWKYATGMLIALLGPDGAGKSTLAEHLKLNLVGPFRRAAVFHLRPGVIGRKNANGPVANPHAKAPHPFWLSLLKVPYYLLDYSVGYLISLRPMLVRSTLVLFDRYYDDLIVDPRRYRYDGPMNFVHLGGLFVPKPDLFLILDVSEESLLERKREVSPEEARRQREAYQKLATERSNAVLLNGSLSPNEVAHNAREAVLDYLHLRYLSRRHLWFRDNDSEILNWLESVLFSSKKSRLALSNAREHEKTEWQTNASFRWLALRDGRGYLIPMNCYRDAVSALRLYNAQTLKAKAAKKLLAVALRGGVGWPFLRKVQVLNRRDVTEKEKKKTSLLERLNEILQQRGLSFAISLGTPGRNRKPVIQVLSQKGETVAYAKVGWNEATNALVRNEADVCGYLSAACFAAFAVPAVLYAGWWEDRFLCIQSAPTDNIETAPQKLASEYVAVLEELRSFHIRWMPLKESAFWRKLSQRVATLQDSFHGDILQQGLCRLEESHHTLPFYFCHGDFAPWNAHLLNGRLFIFDWEYADFEAPPLWDLFHFAVQTMWLLQNRTPTDVLQAVFDDGIKNARIRTYLESLSLNGTDLRSLFSIYLLDRVAFYASDNNADERSLRYFADLSSHVLADENSSL
jgi:thymidylate kinase